MCGIPDQKPVDATLAARHANLMRGFQTCLASRVAGSNIEGKSDIERSAALT
jgi:hypothetical protein